MGCASLLKYQCGALMNVGYGMPEKMRMGMEDFGMMT